MDNKNLSMILRDEARNLGLCDQWFSEWTKGETEDSLLEKYKRGLDFCIERDWPTNKFMKDNFSEKALIGNNIYIDKKIDLRGEDGIYVLNGNTSGTIVIPDFSVSTIYIRHKCDIKLICLDYSKVFVTLMDEASLKVDCKDSSKCYVYVKGDECCLSCSGNVLVR